MFGCGIFADLCAGIGSSPNACDNVSCAVGNWRLRVIDISWIENEIVLFVNGDGSDQDA